MGERWYGKILRQDHNFVSITQAFITHECIMFASAKSQLISATQLHNGHSNIRFRWRVPREIPRFLIISHLFHLLFCSVAFKMCGSPVTGPPAQRKFPSETYKAITINISANAIIDSLEAVVTWLEINTSRWKCCRQRISCFWQNHLWTHLSFRA